MGEWQTIGRHRAKKKSPMSGEPSGKPRQLTISDYEVTLGGPRVRSEIRPRTLSDDDCSNVESLTESACRVCPWSPRYYDLPTFGKDEESKILEFLPRHGPIYGKPHRYFGKWTLFTSYHLDRLDEWWNIAEQHVGQRLTVQQLIRY